jgi:hypothetical protein
VPNKSATLVQALLAYVTLSGEESILEEYILPSLDKILMFQVKEGDLVGGIYQNMLHGKVAKSCFPYYVARCISALLLGYQTFGRRKYLDAALAAGSFLIAHRYPDGSFPQVIYHHGRVNRYPQWIAPAADILLALDQLTRFGFEYDRQPTFDWILDGELPGGGFLTGVGFGKAQFPKQKIDPRDQIACVGWVDKVFRYLSAQLIRVGKKEHLPTR